MDKFSALSEPTRRDILEMLARDGQLSASEISVRFHVSPSAISQHLKVLREANLVMMEKKAQQRLYTLNPAGIEEVTDWTAKMKRMWNERFDALDEVLKAEKDRLITGMEQDNGIDQAKS